MNGEVKGNKRRHIYECKRCGKHVNVLADIQIPKLVYCTPCAIKILDNEGKDDNTRTT